MNVPDRVTVSGPALAAILNWLALQPFGRMHEVAPAAMQLLAEVQAQPEPEKPAEPAEPDPQP